MNDDLRERIENAVSALSTAGDDLADFLALDSGQLAEAYFHLFVGYLTATTPDDKLQQAIDHFTARLPGMVTAYLKYINDHPEAAQ